MYPQQYLLHVHTFALIKSHSLKIIDFRYNPTGFNIHHVPVPFIDFLGNLFSHFRITCCFVMRVTKDFIWNVLVLR